MSGKWKFLRYEVRDNIGILTVSRPEKLNALNAQVYREIGEAAVFAEASSVRGLIITGDGEKAFVAGADIREMSGMTKKEAGEFAGLCNDSFRKLELLKIPVIAAVNGYALGGGCELALACHTRICSENAVFGLPEVTLGVIPGSGGTQRMAKLVGAGMAKELLFTGRRIKAEEAVRIGLVKDVVPKEQLLHIAQRMIDERTGERKEDVTGN